MLRAIIADVTPGAQEIVDQDPLGRGPGGAPRGRLPYPARFTGPLSLRFFYAATLPCPESRLQGTGRRLRQAKIRTAEGAAGPVIAQLLLAAGGGEGPGPLTRPGAG